MTIKRRNRFAFTDDGPSTSKAICNSCYENNITTFTIPYIMDNGREDKGFRKCPYCLALTPVRLTRYNSETQPLGGNSIGKAQFEVANPSRSRSRRNRQSEPDFDIPKFGNFEDKELKSMVENGAIILSVNDEKIDSTEEDY